MGKLKPRQEKPLAEQWRELELMPQGPVLLLKEAALSSAPR